MHLVFQAHCSVSRYALLFPWRYLDAHFSLAFRNRGPFRALDGFEMLLSDFQCLEDNATRFIVSLIGTTYKWSEVNPYLRDRTWNWNHIYVSWNNVSKSIFKIGYFCGIERFSKEMEGEKESSLYRISWHIQIIL